MQQQNGNMRGEYMQNKFLHILLMTSIMGYVPHALAQEEPAQEPEQPVVKETAPTQTLDYVDPMQNTAVAPDIAGKQSVDFPARSSMGSLEFAPLPGINQTPIEGPMPLTPSVSSKDLPSEQLLGRVNPEVFQEMAELERDNTFLQLQVKKEQMKNQLEKVKATYRKERLDEIASREALIRSRIEWWQDQERIRLDLEKQRAEAENVKNALEEAHAAQMIAAVDQEAEPAPEQAAPQLFAQMDDVPPMGTVAAYSLLSIQGTHQNLTARIRNTDSGKISNVHVGDVLSTGDVITSITPTQVIMAFQGAEYILTFEDGQ
jgi:hypothetical protein